MSKIWHDDSLKAYKDAAENRTSISVLVLPIFSVKNGLNCKNNPKNLVDDPKKFVLGKFFENVRKWFNSQSYHEKSDI
jgi:hypothetical protein